MLTLRWREPDSNHQSREGAVGAFRKFSRCRLFRLSGAEVSRRNAGRIGGFEEGEFEADGAKRSGMTVVPI